jgi:hypothetical protein
MLGGGRILDQRGCAPQLPAEWIDGGEFSGISHRESIWENPLNSRPVAPPIEEDSMDAYHIDRFGSVDGIVRRSTEDPRPGPKDILMRVRAS